MEVITVWNGKHVYTHVRVCVCACVHVCVFGWGGEGRRMTASPSKPDARARNQRSTTVWFSGPMYTYLFPLNLLRIPIGGTLALAGKFLWLFLPTWH